MKFEILGPSNEVVHVVETSANPVRIGKNGSYELCLDDASVSRVHAVLEKSGNGYKLSDRVSMGGTFVNDVKVDPGKGVMVESGSILRFGNVSVRLTLEEAGIEEEEEEEGGATLAVSLDEVQNVDREEPAAPEVAAAPAAPAAAASAAPAVAAAPRASLAGLGAVGAKAASAAKPSGGMGGFGASGFTAGSAAPTTTIIKKKKRPVSFERRFLSAKSKTGRGNLEVAMVWQDTVLSIQAFKPKDKVVTVGSGKGCNYKVETGNGASISIAQYVGDHWELLFNNSFDGFVLIGDNKYEFKAGSNAEFTTPKSAGNILAPGSLACEVTGMTRAKYVFGEASILVHSVDPTPFATTLFGNFRPSRYGSLAASLLIHFMLFSVILFATNRVDALMVDRILTASRFATAIEEPIVEDEKEEEKEDEKPKEEEEVDETKPSDTPFAANTPSDAPGPGKGPLSKSEAQAAAQATGLLAQAQAMNSMLAAGLDMQNLDNLDWSSFDSSAAAATGGYGLGTTGTGGGGAGLGGFNNGGFGPGGPGGSGAIRAAGTGYAADLGKKGEAKPAVKMKNPEVTGSLDKRIIQKVVRQHSGELRACYEKELAKVKGLNGRVVVVWIISPQGVVSKALVKESTIKNKAVEDCVVNSIKFWRFPVPKGGGMVQIEYPFVFELSNN